MPTDYDVNQRSEPKLVLLIQSGFVRSIRKQNTAVLGNGLNLIFEYVEAASE